MIAPPFLSVVGENLPGNGLHRLRANLLLTMSPLCICVNDRAPPLMPLSFSSNSHLEMKRESIGRAEIAPPPNTAWLFSKLLSVIETVTFSLSASVLPGSSGNGGSLAISIGTTAIAPPAPMTKLFSKSQLDMTIGNGPSKGERSRVSKSLHANTLATMCICACQCEAKQNQVRNKEESRSISSMIYEMAHLGGELESQRFQG